VVPVNIEHLLQLVPLVRDSVSHEVRASYDPDADVLYVTFRDAPATESELQDDDVIVRYDGGEVIGLTILHASSRVRTG
jgi:uncharacterized protein YuzE